MDGEMLNRFALRVGFLARLVRDTMPENVYAGLPGSDSEFLGLLAREEGMARDRLSPFEDGGLTESDFLRAKNDDDDVGNEHTDQGGG